MTRRLTYGAILWCVLLILSGCRDIEFLTSQPSRGDIAEDSIYIESPEMESYKGPHLDKVMRADTGQLFEGRQRLELEGVVFEYYEAGKFVGKLKADKAMVYLENFPEIQRNKNDAVLSGNILYETAEGGLLTTENLIWDNVTEKLYTDTKFRMESPTEKGTMILEGSRFETDRTMSKWKDYGASFKVVPKKKKI